MASSNINPIFTITPNIGIVTISVANTNRDGTGTFGTIISSGNNGTRIDRVEIAAIGTTTNNVVRLFLDNGSTKKLEKEILVNAITPGTLTTVFLGTINYPNGLVLPSGWFLDASTNASESYNIIAFAGDF